MPKQYEINRGTWENKDLVGVGKKKVERQLNQLP